MKKQTNKKETVLSVLKDIRERLDVFIKQGIHKDLEVIGQPIPVSNLFKITDDGIKKTSELLNDCRSKFKVWSYYSDEQLDKDFPPTKISTTRYFKKTIEPDEDLMNKSAEDLERENVQGITLRERLIMELQYFNETGNNLDVQCITHCSGSRFAGGYVPYVYRSDGGWVHVSWSRPQYRSSSFGARRAVPYPSSL